MKIPNILKHPLLQGSLVMVLGSNLFNLGQFIYHFIAGRYLGKAHYGDLAVIISVLGFISIIQLSVGLTIVKFIAAAKSEKEVSNLAKWFIRWAFLLGGILAVLSLILSPLIVDFLNIADPSAVYLLAPTLFLTVVIFTQRSILQGLLSFGRFVVSLLTEVTFKIILTVIFVSMGMKVFGALSGIVLGVLTSFFVTRYLLSRHLVGQRGDRPNALPLLKYSLPVFLQGLALTSMYSTDFILVKHFFSEGEAGIYASLAVLGRVAFFSSSPIIHVMFPLVAKKYAAGEPYLKFFYLSILLIMGISAVVILFYFLFPGFVVGLLYGAEYIEGASMLWWFGLFMSILCVATLFTQYYLSIEKTRVIWFFVAAAILQGVLIWFIHPNILTVIKLSILSATLLLISLIVYFPYCHKNGKKTSLNNRSSLQTSSHNKKRFKKH